MFTKGPKQAGLFYGNKKHSQNGTGKSWKSWLLSVPFWLILFLS